MSEIKKQGIPQPERTHGIATVLWVTLFLNIAVSSAKIVLGAVTGCTAILADGFHSLSDGTSNVVGLIAIHVSGRTADRDHPYGHKKYENLASGMIALFLFMVAFGIIRKAVTGLLHPEIPEIDMMSFLVMAATLAVNIVVVLYERAAGKKLASDFLIADSWHTLTDVFVTIGVLLAMVGISFNIPYLDPVFSIVIGLCIVVSAFKILRQSFEVLVDHVVVKADDVEKIARSIPGVMDCHEIRTRGREDHGYCDLHILVDDKMTVFASHELANTIERSIKDRIPSICDVIVHIEPISHVHKKQ